MCRTPVGLNSVNPGELVPDHAIHSFGDGWVSGPGLRLATVVGFNVEGDAAQCAYGIEEGVLSHVISPVVRRNFPVKSRPERKNDVRYSIGYFRQMARNVAKLVPAWLALNAYR
jgi:hypothetical protein